MEAGEAEAKPTKGTCLCSGPLCSQTPTNEDKSLGYLWLLSPHWWSHCVEYTCHAIINTSIHPCAPCPLSHLTLTSLVPPMSESHSWVEATSHGLTIQPLWLPAQPGSWASPYLLLVGVTVRKMPSASCSTSLPRQSHTAPQAGASSKTESISSVCVCPQLTTHRVLFFQIQPNVHKSL